ncbi:glycoside hydrolase family 16 protein [Phanerochaete carnosa HHB-10118-sp]|uniref:Glycoside hydrolase family 16 protein n=1 Tax=Phanerochaete carnosa (strain HHB-10118-sp) TaxID=650164 RepID=K5W257_PHACS|nr:glycoside hydrolase family 16 protein [Phanerochaete carnosa HHB-10118-sp]EKM53200.1 glycoside hydrolase family 16 protein [Phanerochaete carnosa HHB-10118-sp]
MYRRRDSGKAAYSSADAYRTPVSPASSASHAPHSSSSEEEAHLTSPDARRADSPGPDSSVDQHAGDDTPLSPPRPFFLAGSRKDSNSSDRGSWSSTNDSVDPASDSDNTDREAAAAAAAAANATQSGPRRVRANTAGTASSTRPRNHHRRRSSQSTSPNYMDSPVQTPPSTSRVPPSAFPFLSHAGNPDPGTPIPANLARRPSRDSAHRLSSGSLPGSPATATGVAYPTSPGNMDGYSALRAEQASTDVADEYAYAPVNGHDQDELGRPHPPFMGDSGSWTPGGGGVYRNSAAAAMAGSNAALSGEGTLPRTNSQTTIPMRAPFLSPASRPTSLWSPPSYPSLPQQHLTSQYPPSLTYLPNSPQASGMSPYRPKMGKAPLPSSRLAAKLTAEDKPWLKHKDSRERCAYFLTLSMWVIGVACAALVIFLGWTGVRQLKDDQLCLILSEDFDSLDLTSTWNAVVGIGSDGNGEFQAYTQESGNLYTRNGELYIMPTLTSESSDLTGGSVTDGGKLTLQNCPSSANCSATSDQSVDQALPPVLSARISTQSHHTIQFGKIEVSAKLPRGDWLWPAIWMLPANNTYGPWPQSGEIDIMEARGNDLTYPAQGDNFVRSTLNYGVFETLQTQIFGWYQQKRTTFAEGFHTYSLEWSPSFIRTYVDSRLQATLTIDITGKGGHSFFDRGHYPAAAHNNTATEIPVTNIWSNSPAAPFDQPFYLILDLAVGGTSGWFPDGVGNKPWVDESGDQFALWSFAQNQSTWSKTWPSTDTDRAFRIDSVKMWQLKQNGKC